MKYNIIMLGRFSHSYARKLRHNPPPDYATAKNAQSKRIDTLENRDAIFRLLSQNVDKQFSAEEIAQEVMGVDTVSYKTCTKFRILLNKLFDEPGSPIQMGSVTNKKGPVSGIINVYWYDEESSSPDAMGEDAEEHDGE